MSAFNAPTLGTGTFSFGTPATSSTTSLSAAATTALPTFGAPTATASAFALPTANAAPTFGMTAAAPTFGAPTATPNFGVPATSAAPTFGLTGTTAPAFGAPTTTTPSLFAANTQAPAFGLGTATSTAPTLGLGAFSFGKPAATSSSSLNFATSTTTLSAPQQAAPFIGLGGVDLAATQKKAGDAQQDIKAKETQVPDEIAKTVEQLKNHVKLQKTLASEIGRTSTTKLSSVSNDIASVEFMLRELSNYVDTNYNQIKSLRKETSKVMQSVEMAQRTQDTPTALQYENTAPFVFFQNLVAKFEQDLINFRQQILVTEQHMCSLTNPQSVTPEHLKRGLQHINESFISLAGRLHEINQKVESLKEQYLNLRKYRLRDTRNVFAELDNPVSKTETTHVAVGPTPFSNITAITNFGKSYGNSAADNSGTRTGSATK